MAKHVADLEVQLAEKAARLKDKAQVRCGVGIGIGIGIGGALVMSEDKAQGWVRRTVRHPSVASS